MRGIQLVPVGRSLVVAADHALRELQVKLRNDQDRCALLGIAHHLCLGNAGFRLLSVLVAVGHELTHSTPLGNAVARARFQGGSKFRKSEASGALGEASLNFLPKSSRS